MSRSWRYVITLAAVAWPGVTGAQQTDAARRAFELERRGSYIEAAEAYRSVLAAHPADAAALFGLERTLLAMNRLGDILPQAQAALTASPTNGPAYGILLRAWSARGESDSVRSVAERWARVAPHD